MFRGNSAMVRGKAHNAVAFFIQYQQNTLQETIFCDSVSALVCGTVNCWVLGAVPRPQQYARPVY